MKNVTYLHVLVLNTKAKSVTILQEVEQLEQEILVGDK